MTARQQVFISYRREHDDAMAGRIRDRMQASVPDWDVFLDVDSISAGADFRAAIDAQLAQSAVFLPLIGKRWLDEINARLNGEDHVRYEVKSALARQDTLRIIPLLVNGAAMPGRDSLPADIADLARLNAANIASKDFDSGFAKLAKEITGRDIVVRLSFVTILATVAKGVITGAAAGFALLVAQYHVTGLSASEWIGEDGAALFLPACAAIGGLAWYWLSARR